jgi:hypothetical protein
MPKEGGAGAALTVGAIGAAVGAGATGAVLHRRIQSLEAGLTQARRDAAQWQQETLRLRGELVRETARANSAEAGTRTLGAEVSKLRQELLDLRKKIPA